MDEAGSTSNECWSDYSKKLEHLRAVDAGAKIRDAAASWPAHAEVLSGLLGEPEAIVAALRAAGAPTRFSELENPSKEDDVIWALTNCHLMRNRFNIADLAYLTGAWTKTDVLAALAEAERIGAGLVNAGPHRNANTNSQNQYNTTLLFVRRLMTFHAYEAWPRRQADPWRPQ